MKQNTTASRTGILPPGYLEHGRGERPFLLRCVGNWLRGARPYVVCGVAFSPEEYGAARTILMGLADCLRENSALAADYDSYAKMGLGEKILWETAEAHGFSEEQTRVILQDYRNNLVWLACDRIWQFQGEEPADPCGACYLVRRENGCWGPYPTVAWDTARIERIYEVFFACGLDVAQEVFEELVRPALATLSRKKAWIEQRLAGYQAGIAALYDRLVEVQLRFVEPWEPWEEPWEKL